MRGTGCRQDKNELFTCSMHSTVFKGGLNDAQHGALNCSRLSLHECSLRYVGCELSNRRPLNFRLLILDRRISRARTIHLLILSHSRQHDRSSLDKSAHLRSDMISLISTPVSFFSFLASVVGILQLERNWKMNARHFHHKIAQEKFISN